ncbi:hypothetical protein C5167_032613 [Papaver somniferum]|uniref:Pectin acetylesterase n=1 Tax=Papaver somniferum TaxID=3469 RepID=A0A4Y7KBE5_PAPSO|nr:hypothetical protein C5167_032613 [Papaver somniferum]
MFDPKTRGFLNVLIILCITLKTNGFSVGITYVENAIAKGAVCLDGSPPAYHMDKGFGAGINNWLVHIEGGGWCNNATTCLARKNNRLGSSKQMIKQIAFSDFYNWNRIKVRYCDGSSFTGDVEAVDPATNLHYRGGRVWLAVIEDLLAKGMKNAENAILSGCSAGGLTSILHCDNFRGLMPASAKVKCLADAGYFINTKDLSGAMHIQELYADVVKTHGSAKNLPVSCTSKVDPSLCFFPRYAAQQIRTPLFILNTAYDSWQVGTAKYPSNPYIFTLSEKQNGTEEHYVAFLLCISDAHLVCLKRYTSIKISGVVRLTWSPTPADDTSHGTRRTMIVFAFGSCAGLPVLVFFVCFYFPWVIRYCRGEDSRMFVAVLPQSNGPFV